MKRFKKWNGEIEKYIDQVHITSDENLTSGCFGGCSEAGACINEDAYIFVSSKSGWKFTVLFDAHATIESALFLSSEFEKNIEKIESICEQSVEIAIPKINEFVMNMLLSKEITNASKHVKGETAVLVCYQKEEYMWWLSVGDNSIYVFHDEFNDLGQNRLNQRVFYQWIGEKNSLGLKVPCYSTGTIQLREGLSKIVLLTDGVLEIKGRPFENNQILAQEFKLKSNEEAVKSILYEVKKRKGRDSATILVWDSISFHEVLRPTRL